MNLLRYPGQGLGMDGAVAAPVLHWSRAPVAHGPGVLAEVRRTEGTSDKGGKRKPGGGNPGTTHETS